MTKETIKTITIICLIIGVVVLSILAINNNKVSDKEEAEIEEVAILDVQVYDWAINLYDESEMFFQYFIYNYGSVEAKNIKVKCLLIEDDYTTIKTSVIDNYGNLASKSYEFGEVITKNPNINLQKEFIGMCYIEDCDNCKILYKEIPKLVDEINDLY